MRIRLPNGKILDGIPKGTPKFQIMDKAIMAGIATPEDFGQESAPSPVEGTGFQEGIGRGMTSIARGAGNLLGVVSDEEAEDANKLDEPLLNTTGGMLGNIAGQTALTLPAGVAASTAARAATAGRAAPGAVRALHQALASPVGRGAVEGAVAGGLSAETDDQGGMALMGAGLGGTFGAAGKLLGNFVRGVTPKLTPEAAKLQQMTGTFIPLSQSLEPGMAKQFYSALISNLPGAGGVVRGQYKNALEDLRRFAAEQAHPPRANMTITPQDDIRAVFGKLEDYWKTAYDDIGVLPVKLFTSSGGRTAWQVPKEVEEAMLAASGGRFKAPSAGQTVTGEVLVNLRRAANELLERVPEGSTLRNAEKAELEGFVSQIDDTLKANLDPTGKGRGQMAQIYRDYLEKNGYYDTYQTLVSAGQKAAKNSEFSPAQLAESAARNTGRSAVRGGASDSLQEVGRLADTALQDFPSRMGLFQTVAALGLGGAATATMGLPGAIGTAGVLGAGRAFASEGVQKLLSGQKDIMRNYAKLLRQLGRASRGLTIEGVSNAKE